MTTQILLGGVSGPASVTLEADGQQHAVTGDFPAPVEPQPTSVYVLHDAQPLACDPLSVTVEGSAFWNGQSFGAGFCPGVISNMFIAQGVEGNRLYLNNLNGYTSYTPELYIGGTLEFRRIVNGEMVLAGTAKVADASFSLLGKAGSYDTRAISGTLYHFRYDSWNGSNQPYWFAVSAVTASGAIGQRSDWVLDIPQSTSASSTVSNTFVETPTQFADDTALPAPGGVSVTQVANGLVDIGWTPVAGAVGYVVWLAFTDPASWPAGQDALILGEVTGTPQAGDLVLWRREIMQLRASMICARVHGDSKTIGRLFPSAVGSGQLNRDTDATGYEVREWAAGEKPSPDLGHYYLHRTLKPQASISDGNYWSSASDNLYYHQKKPGDVLVVDVWMRASRPVTVRFTSGQPSEPLQSFEVGTDWAFYRLTSDYVKQNAGTMAYRWSLRADAGEEALEMDFAQLRVYLQEADYGAPRASMVPALVAGQKYRDHQLIKTRPRSYTAKIATSPAGEGFAGWTCGMHMQICEDHGLIPWVQLEWSLPKEDWLLWAEWLATTYPDAGTVMLEFGNENWNTLAAFWTMPGLADSATGTNWSSAHVYGMTSRMIWQWLQESPYWPQLASKLELVIGGRLGHSYGEDAWSKCPEAKYVTVANYNGGWDVEATVPAETGQYFRSMTAFQGKESSLIQRETALHTMAQNLGKTVGTDVFHDLYEAGPGYQMNGLNGASLTAEMAITQECVKKSRASALAQLDAVCTCWRRGWLSNFFCLGAGSYWTSHREDGTEYLIHAVGRVISESLGRFRAHDIYPMKVTSTDSVADIGVFSFESTTYPGKWLHIALNRRIDRSVLPPADPLYDAADTGICPVTICTPHGQATGCRVFRAGIGNMRAHDRYAEGLRKQAAGGYAADPLCVAFDTGWHDCPVPQDPGRLVIGPDFGIGADGLNGGNFVMIELSGVA
ncbi:hypothetical protein D2T29_13585 [Sinirhodobacter populi]|uniref:Uncharacterized protein n=1 Tax=Paenirhodobacter populi TaxID=2306993 RepID=A0A443KAK8_9RHOB|nr:hypothetical protein [Sinirhodobacter populi]RWR29814.1 hypothetical protein D2T29_13585 [Sinirhodobacter populi]